MQGLVTLTRQGPAGLVGHIKHAVMGQVWQMPVTSLWTSMPLMRLIAGVLVLFTVGVEGSHPAGRLPVIP